MKKTKHSKAPTKVRVFLDLPGGLGNQLFAYYFASSLCPTKDYELYLNTRYIDLSHSNGNSTIKDYAFDSNVHFYDFGYVLNRLFEPAKRHLKLFNKFRHLKILVLDDSDIGLKQSEVHNLVEGQAPKVIIVFGFWQNLSYFNKEKRLQLKSPSPEYVDLSRRMNQDNPIVFHYRLGRKNGTWEHAWGALDSKYFEAAQKRLFLHNPHLVESPIWIFSNDIAEARSILADGRNNTFVDDSRLAPSELFELIAQSTTLICSNSTFSVLAAKVGETETVVVPNQMSVNGGASIKGIPDHWLSVESSWLA